MADILNARQRSKRMRLIKAENTKPELKLRAILSAFEYRVSMHVSTLPGKPDFVIPDLKKVIFLHGCFWHGHLTCSAGRPPKTRKSFWLPKLLENRNRDVRVKRALNRLGFKTLTVWQCQLNHHEDVMNRLHRFLRKPS